MTEHVERAALWFYRGVWGVLARWFHVPRQPPELPLLGGESATAFQPAEGFLRYLKIQFWIVLVLIDGLILVGWLAITIVAPIAGLILVPVAIFLAVVPDIFAYVAIHLRYDTTWYVMTQRSLRIRRGIWVIRETTITFENVQNVSVSQGPLQRFFGIANVLIETAGGGDSTQGMHSAGSGDAHRGLIEGIDNAPHIREQILARLKISQAAGLGDEMIDDLPAVTNWGPEHLVVLREIRDCLAEEPPAHESPA